MDAGADAVEYTPTGSSGSTRGNDGFPEEEREGNPAPPRKKAVECLLKQELRIGFLARGEFPQKLLPGSLHLRAEPLHERGDRKVARIVLSPPVREEIRDEDPGHPPGPESGRSGLP